MASTIYVLDDDRVSAKMVSAVLEGHEDYRTEVFHKPAKLIARCADSHPDAVITDLMMPDINGIEVTRQLREIDRFLPVFVLTGQGTITTAVEALKAGASEYLLKPANSAELLTKLARALEERPLREDALSLAAQQRESFSLRAILGEHDKVNEVREFVRRMADIPRPTVLLLGESGTGKNLVARALHHSSPHSKGRFVEINCSALPSHLLEGELFGYTEGAFTDARRAKRGLIEVANGGTLFLDELGDMPVELQAKLLQFLESRTFRRLGGTTEIQVELRLVTATNRNLEQAVRDSSFRSDLYYRVSVASHTLPPLREIKSDIPLIADNFREWFRREFRKEVRSLPADVVDALTSWSWPGNVRELRNVIERAMIFADGPTLKVTDLPELSALQDPAQAAQPAPNGGFQLPADLSLVNAEKEYIRQSLVRHEHDLQRVSEVLGISRKNLWEKRKKHGLD